MILELIAEALISLRTNLLRTILTMIGIILGVAAVVAIMTLGRSAYVTAEEDLLNSSYGKIKIISGNAVIPLSKSTINLLLAANINQVLGYEPGFYDNVTQAYNQEDDSYSVNYNYSYPQDLTSLKILRGAFFTEEDLDSYSQVIVIDEQTAVNLFLSIEEALGESLRINDNFYRIIGVFKGERSFSSEIGIAHLPITLGELKPLFQTYGYDYINVNVELGADYEKVTQDIRLALNEAYGFEEEEEKAFQVNNVKEMIAEFSKFMNAFSLGLSLIAAISLLVGGVGIMNIMLVSVTERTREIGLMKALGAQEKDITFQFLVESVVLTVFGGILGIILGLGGSWLVIYLANTFGEMANLPQFRFVINYWAIIVSFLVAVFIGLIFGAYPARRATKLDPVEALRHD